jgi:hypothetical protein
MKLRVVDPASPGDARLRRIVGAALASGGTLAALTLVAACGDIYADPSGDPVEPPRPDFDGSAVFPQDTPSHCPARRPIENAPCSAPGSTCEYGRSPDMQCNSTLACIGGVTTGAPGSLPPPPTSGGPTDRSYWYPRPSIVCRLDECPDGDIAAVDGQPCAFPTVDGGPPADADELVCPRTDGICACTTGRDAAHAHERRWVCHKPIAQCPTQRPLAGQTCEGNLWCDYGSCDFKRGLLMQCRDGVWITGGASCD